MKTRTTVAAIARGQFRSDIENTFAAFETGGSATETMHPFLEKLRPTRTESFADKVTDYTSKLLFQTSRRSTDRTSSTIGSDITEHEKQPAAAGHSFSFDDFQESRGSKKRQTRYFSS